MLFRSIGVVIAALISWGVARSTINKEIKKMRITWEHEKEVSSDQEFSKMVWAVSRYIKFQSIDDSNKALKKVAKLRAKTTGPLSTKLDDLYSQIEKKDFPEISACLTAIIEENRAHKEQSLL